MPDATSIGANELVSQAVGGTNTSFAYDAWGRMTSKSNGTYSATHAYRYGGKLASVMSDFPSEGNASYQYDGAGKRRQRTGGGTTARYRWDVGWNVLNEEDNLGSLARTHIMDSPLAEVAGILGDVAGANPATGAYRYYVSDHLGSTRGLYDGGKSALGGYEYSPYGELYAKSGSVALEGLAAAFTGKPWDAAAQMHYFPYRWYSPSAARWLTRDPLGAVDGPNVYAYVGMNPINSYDFLGLQGFPPYPWPVPGPAQPPPPPFPPKERASNNWMIALGYVGCVTACVSYLFASDILLAPATITAIGLCLAASPFGFDRDSCFQNVAEEAGQMQLDIWCNTTKCLDKCDSILEKESIIDWLGF